MCSGSPRRPRPPSSSGRRRGRGSRCNCRTRAPRPSRSRSSPHLSFGINDDRDVGERVRRQLVTCLVKKLARHAGAREKHATMPLSGQPPSLRVAVAVVRARLDHLRPAPLGLCQGASVGGEADRRPVGAVRALVSVEVEDGHAADRDTFRVVGLASGSGGRVVDAFDGDCVAVAHVLKAEGLRLVVDLGQAPRPPGKLSAAVTGAVHDAIAHVVNGATVQAVAEGAGAINEAAPLHAVAWLELGHSVTPFSLMSAAWLSTAASMRACGGVRSIPSIRATPTGWTRSWMGWSSLTATVRRWSS